MIRAVVASGAWWLRDATRAVVSTARAFSMPQDAVERVHNVEWKDDEAMNQSTQPPSASPPPSSKITRAEHTSDECVTVAFDLPEVSGTDVVRTLHTSWLRHNCPSNLEPSSGQKAATDPATFAPTCVVDTMSLLNGGQTLEVTWARDGHVSTYDSSWLAEYVVPEIPAALTFGGQMNLSSQHLDLQFPPTSRKPLQELSWDSVVESQEGLLQWLDALASDGMCLISGAPLINGTVTQLASAISLPQPTIYGPSTFDVVSVPEPINIAYSPLGLPLHQDLVYYESPPGLQLLHCLDFADTVHGGESTLLDGEAILEEFRVEQPQHFRTLCAVPTRFQKVHYNRDVPVHMIYHRPIISTNAWGRITQFTWAPPFEGPLPNYGADVTAAYYDAYCALADKIDTSPLTHEFRLRPGDIVSFNNRRALHGRRAFASTDRTTPRRHLQGVYINIDDFKNKFHVLTNTLKPHQTPSSMPLDTTHVWNQDSF
mmetsp:Transcript_8582/g.12024  ORF Transcript_8582/g.12024 Transcript_8582/m.12024 type:complete len:485 (+) Transcript_8582:188-1642(+)